jgi:hypothetical protein
MSPHEFRKCVHAPVRYRKSHTDAISSMFAQPQIESAVQGEARPIDSPFPLVRKAGAASLFGIRDSGGKCRLTRQPLLLAWFCLLRGLILRLQTRPICIWSRLLQLFR